MSDDFMKSALDRAMERADRIEIPEERLKEMKYRDQGEKLAASFLKDTAFPLGDQLGKLDAEAKRYVSKAVESILLQNLILPRREADAIRNETVFQGLSALKNNAGGLKQAQDQLANLSSYYAQATKQNYDQLKSQIEQMAGPALRQKMGLAPGAKLNVETLPEFQENWRQVSGKLDTQYGEALNQLKQQITSLS